MSTPGATTAGKLPGWPLHADRPLALSGQMTPVVSTAPTANALGLLAGLTLLAPAGPLFPAANTGVMPAATSAARSASNSRLQPGTPWSHELLTICGASAVLGLPSGSSVHCNARWILLVVALPRSLKILAAIHFAPGATPIAVPPCAPPTITLIVHVPWPAASKGELCWPYGSYQLFAPPRQEPARSGWPTSTPVSRLAITTPWPV